MREIIFRGKRTDNGKWAEGYLDCDSSRKIVFIRTPVNNYTDVNMVSLETIGQYTGLTDKNGKRIFEGDIVKWDAFGIEDEYTELVEWDYTLFDQHKYAWNTRCEVIGNIYDNPELLDE